MTFKWHLNKARAAIALLLALATAGQACAGCTASSSGLAFGAYQPLTLPGKLTSVAVTSSATVSVTCHLPSGLAGYTLKLGPSLTGNSINPRYMVNSRGGNNMVFNVYTDANYSNVWGNGLIGSSIAHGLLNGTFAHTVYGRIPAGQNTLKAGNFSSSLTITVTYNL